MFSPDPDIRNTMIPGKNYPPFTIYKIIKGIFVWEEI
jgi:hypothetical protein